MLRTRLTTAAVVGAAALLVGSYVLLRAGERAWSGTDLGEATAPTFSLEAAGRGAVSLEHFEGSVLLLTFGRACPEERCRATLRTLDQALDHLGDRRRDVRVAFITTDPSDRADDLRAFVQDVDLGMTGLVGDSVALARIAAAYGARVPETGGAAAEVAPPETFPTSPTSPGSPTSAGHAPGIFGIDRAGRLRLYWGPEAEPDAIAGDVRRLLGWGF